MDGTFASGNETLACYVREPADDGRSDAAPGVLLCHGFPIGPLDARRSAGTYPQLVDRIAYEVNLPAMTFNFTGCGTSTGDFSLQGWVDDLRAAIEHLCVTTGVHEVLLVGTNTGGSIAVCVGADDPRVSGCALLSPSTSFDEWAEHPRRFLERARELGAIRSPGYPLSVDNWARAFRRFRPLAATKRFAPRPMMVMHGDDDQTAPSTAARQFVQAHGAAELSLISGAGHRLRHDPRAIAILLGWLDRVAAR